MAIHAAVLPLWNKLPPVLRHISDSSYVLTKISILAISLQLFYSKLKTVLLPWCAMAVLLPWCGGACLAGRSPICASFATLSPRVHAVVHSGPLVQFARSATMQTRSFSVVGPNTWNRLPVDLRHLPIGACSQFHHLLKTVLFRLAWVGSASE